MTGRRDTRDPSSFSVVYHGSIGYDQALDSIVRSIPRWPPAVRLHIYGNPFGSYARQLKELVETIGVSGRVIFEGWISLGELFARLGQHDVGLSLLRPNHENWRTSIGASNKRYQLMAVGIPQISDDQPQVRKLIEDCQVGRCVSPDDPNAIANAVWFFFENQKTREEYGRRARILHKTELNYEREFAPILKLIQSHLSIPSRQT